MARFTTSCGAIENVIEALPTQNAMVEQYKVSYIHSVCMTVTLRHIQMVAVLCCVQRANKLKFRLGSYPY